MKLTVSKFLEKGYSKYKTCSIKNSDSLLQKVIKDEQGVKYYINVYVYEWSKKPWFNEKIDGEIGFQPEVQFRSAKYDTMNITLLVDDMTDVEEIEETFENMWKSVGGPYDELY